jgi:undecaprenyl phosphate N,N'-diacetylbacillosamine 1-phosphate transferase
MRSNYEEKGRDMDIAKRERYAMRLFDLLASLVALILLSPLFVVIILLIKLGDGGPVFFFQKRPGKGGRSFVMWKFRSMVVGADKTGSGLYIDGENDRRITPVGRFLRKWSLDELPQLINVIKGEMSLVGPRPGMHFQAEQYTPRQRGRLCVKPGLTGWAQINGRNSLSWPERIELDLWYIENRSFLLNLWITLITIPAVLHARGLYADREKYLITADDKFYDSETKPENIGHHPSNETARCHLSKTTT